MIGFGLNIVGGLFNLFLYKRYDSETNLVCCKINFFLAIVFLVLYLTSTPFLEV